MWQRKNDSKELLKKIILIVIPEIVAAPLIERQRADVEASSFIALLITANYT